MAAFDIILTICILHCLQIDAILNRDHKYYQRLPTHKYKRLSNNADAEDFDKNTILEEVADLQRTIEKHQNTTNKGATITRNVDKPADKGLTVLEIHFIKNNYYVNSVPNNKSGGKRNIEGAVGKKHEIKEAKDGKTKVGARGSETMLKVVNFGDKKSEHVIDKIVFPDTNITAILNSHNRTDLIKSDDYTSLRTKPFNDKKVDKDLNKIENITLEKAQNITEAPLPITNAPVDEYNVKKEINKNFVLIPVMSKDNKGGMFQEGKPITFYPVSVDKLKQYARGNTEVAATPTVDSNVPEDNENQDIGNITSLPGITRNSPMLSPQTLN